MIDTLMTLWCNFVFEGANLYPLVVEHPLACSNGRNVSDVIYPIVSFNSPSFFLLALDGRLEQLSTLVTNYHEFKILSESILRLKQH